MKFRAYRSCEATVNSLLLKLSYSANCNLTITWPALSQSEWSIFLSPVISDKITEFCITVFMQMLETAHSFTYIHVSPFLFSTELHDSLQSSPSDRMAVVSKKVAYLGKVYVHSERYFPLGKYKLIYSAQTHLARCSNAHGNISSSN